MTGPPERGARPSDSEDVASLRPIEPADKTRLTRFHARLSDETRYRRYHGSKGELTRSELAYLTEVDHVDHVAVVADRGDGELAAVARVVSNGDGTAEVAVVVADDCRGMGHGLTSVVAALERFAASGSDGTVLAHVQSDNTSALRLFVDRLGGRAVGRGDGVAVVVLPRA